MPVDVERINWSPAKSGGASFKTKNLEMQDPHRWQYKNTSINKLFSLLFIVMGSFALLTFLLTIFVFFLTFPFAIAGIIFIIIGSIMRKRSKKAIVFDFKSNTFWLGDPNYDPSMRRTSKVDYLFKLDEVIGIQIMSEAVTVQRSNMNDNNFGPTSTTFSSYELNLILNDYSRVNVVDHGNLNAIKYEAKVLGEKLDVPVFVAQHLQAD